MMTNTPRFGAAADIGLRLTPEEVTALYQAACGYHVREPGKKEALLSALSKLVDAATIPTLLQMVAK